MKKIGFIGLGHMASALVRAFICSKSIPAKNIIISNRSISKLHKIKADFPAIQIENREMEMGSGLFCLHNHYYVDIG